MTNLKKSFFWKNSHFLETNELFAKKTQLIRQKNWTTVPIIMFFSWNEKWIFAFYSKIFKLCKKSINTRIQFFLLNYYFERNSLKTDCLPKPLLLCLCFKNAFSQKNMARLGCSNISKIILCSWDFILLEHDVMKVRPGGKFPHSNKIGIKYLLFYVIKFPFRV